MQVKLFPFGKYAGTPLNELPSTYIVFALESLKLDEEMETELRMIIFGRLKVFSSVMNTVSGMENNDEFYDLMDVKIEQYEK